MILINVPSECMPLLFQKTIMLIVFKDLGKYACLDLYFKKKASAELTDVLRHRKYLYFSCKVNILLSSRVLCKMQEKEVITLVIQTASTSSSFKWTIAYQQHQKIEMKLKEQERIRTFSNYFFGKNDFLKCRASYKS